MQARRAGLVGHFDFCSQVDKGVDRPPVGRAHVSGGDDPEPAPAIAHGAKRPLDRAESLQLDEGREKVHGVGGLHLPGDLGANAGLIPPVDEQGRLREWDLRPRQRPRVRWRLRRGQQRQEDLVRGGRPVAETVKCLRDRPDELGHHLVADTDPGRQSGAAIAADAAQRPPEGPGNVADQEDVGVGGIEGTPDDEPRIDGGEALVEGLGDELLVEAGGQLRGKLNHRREGYI